MAYGRDEVLVELLVRAERRSRIRIVWSCALVYESKKSGCGGRTPAADRNASQPGVATNTAATFRRVSSESFVSAGKH